MAQLDVGLSILPDRTEPIVCALYLVEEAEKYKIN